MKMLTCAIDSFFFYVLRLFFFFFFNLILFLNLKHSISFAKHQNKSATGIHVLPLLNPPPSSLPYFFIFIMAILMYV